MSEITESHINKQNFNTHILLSKQQHCDSTTYRHAIAQLLPVLLTSTRCWTHNQSEHDFFINYRVSSEGKKNPVSFAVCILFIYYSNQLFSPQRNMISNLGLFKLYMKNLQLSGTEESLHTHFGIRNACVLVKTGNKVFSKGC